MTKADIRKALLLRDGNVCAFCGAPGGDTDQTKLTLDRIKPGSEGGKYTLENCRLLCRSCNCARGDKSDKHVRWASGVFQAGFTIVPNAVLLRDDLKTDTRMLWAVLAHFAREEDSCYPGQERLAHVVGISERRLRDAVTELVDAELVRVQQRGRGQTNLYVLRDPRFRRDRQALPPGSACGAGQDRQEVPVSSDKDAVEEKAVEEEGATADAAASDEQHLPGMEPPPSPPPSTADQPVIDVWEHYVAVFSHRLRVKDLTPPRVRTIQKALRAVDGDAATCKRAIDGLKSYRDQHRGGSQDVSISVIFETGPHSRSNLTDQIAWWAEQAPAVPGSIAKMPIDLSGVPSVLAGTIRARRSYVVDLERERHEYGDDSVGDFVRRRGEEAVIWLREQCGHEPVVHDDGRVTWGEVAE